MTKHKLYAFSTTNENLQEILDEWKENKMLSAQVILNLKKALKVK